FYSLFSLLFGIGFSVILTNNAKRGANAIAIFYRRMFILLIIGAIHLFLFWEGDILFLYAMIGMLLPLFRKASDRSLIIMALALICAPLLIDFISVLTQVRTGEYITNMAIVVDKKTGVPLDDSFASYLFKEGSGWHEWRNWQASGYLYRYGYIIESNRIPKVIGLFLLGFYAGRKLIFRRLEDYMPLFKKLRFWGFVAGIPGSIALAYVSLDKYHVPHKLGLIDTALYMLTVVPLSLAYVSAICIHWQRSNGTSWMKILAPIGRMALTNYFLQTLFGIFFFYGVGLGFGGKIGPTLFWPIAIAFYILQIFLSRFWLSRFNYGPLEWVWRQFTYGKRLPLLKTK
ncbi:MAG: DUF418 domain-containing protein, partial [Gemmatimonadaceae bacterium]|nr:DUF418 domain-containing protein [Chitinophagaceae bacterium]